MDRSETTADVVRVTRGHAGSPIVVVCEHASHHIPEEFAELGLSPEARYSHAAWDPGALGVAEILSDRLDAALVASRVSRLVYDCNRPPGAPDAMPARSEAFEIPGNADLSPAQRAERVRRYYDPFRRALAQQVAATRDPVLVTIHSFTPVFHGKIREVGVGIVHDRDPRLADAMLEAAAGQETCRVARNAPYGPQDGVTHTLREHALPDGHRNVMIELRNDLITTPEAQADMANQLATWITAAVAQTEALRCKV